MTTRKPSRLAGDRNAIRGVNKIERDREYGAADNAVLERRLLKINIRNVGGGTTRDDTRYDAPDWPGAEPGTYRGR